VSCRSGGGSSGGGGSSTSSAHRVGGRLQRALPPHPTNPQPPTPPRYHLPKRLVMRMAVNQAIDSCVGIVPFFGDMFDVYFKGGRSFDTHTPHDAATASPRSDLMSSNLIDHMFLDRLPFCLLLLLHPHTTTANKRNMKLLEAHLEKPGKAKRADTCYLFWVFFIVSANHLCWLRR